MKDCIGAFVLIEENKMNGKICDRCGVLYKPEAASPIYKKVMPYGIYEEVDLCRACRESFKAWMEFYN